VHIYYFEKESHSIDCCIKKKLMRSFEEQYYNDERLLCKARFKQEKSFTKLHCWEDPAELIAFPYRKIVMIIRHRKRKQLIQEF
jgi:hypothetical protein